MSASRCSSRACAARWCGAGFSVAPFKPQNMSNNAAVTADGGEIGRAQALQARAARLRAVGPHEPGAAEAGERDRRAGDRPGPARRHDARAPTTGGARPSCCRRCWRASRSSARDADIVLVEGAGSPAEVNLRAGDIANMGFAEAADVPVVLVGDIDRGGVIASLVGTHAVLAAGRPRAHQGLHRSTSSAAMPALFADGVAHRSRSGPAGRASASCRGSPAPRACRPRTSLGLADSARASRCDARRSPCRRCRASPISTISIRCAWSPACRS